MFVFLAYPVASDANDTFNVTATPPSGFPTVTTNDATNVEETTVTLNGLLVDDNGSFCQYRFEYDTNSGVPYASSTSWTGAIATGETFSQAIVSLTKGELYFFRAQCRNINGIGSGGEKSFLTKPDEPSFFQAFGSAEKIRLTWTRGNGADMTVVVRKQGIYPADRSDGTVIYNDTGGMYDDTNVSSEIYYYYRAWSYCSEGGLSRFSDNYDESSDNAAPRAIPRRPPPVEEKILPTVVPAPEFPIWLIIVSAAVAVVVFMIIAFYMG